MFPLDPNDLHADDHRFDDALRAKLDDLEENPAPGTWAALDARLPLVPLPDTRHASRWARLRLFGGGISVGALLMLSAVLGLRPTASSPEASAANLQERQLVVIEPKLSIAPNAVAEVAKGVTNPIKEGTDPVQGETITLKGVSNPFNRVRAPFSGVLPTRQTAPSSEVVDRVGKGRAHADTVVRERIVVRTVPVVLPSAMAWIRTQQRDTVLREARAAAAAAPTDTARAARVRNLVLAQATDLALLNRQLDSLKRALPEVSFALPSPAPDPIVPTQRVAPLVKAPRWSLLLGLETSPAWAGPITTNPSESIERGSRVQTQAAQVGYRFGAAGAEQPGRWQVRGGVGVTQLYNQFTAGFGRTTSVTRDTTITSTQVTVHTGTAETMIVRLDSIPRYEPRLNGQLQVISYDTTWVSTNDTTYQRIITHDTIRTQQLHTIQQTRTLVEQHKQVLRPEYKFWSLPFAVGYQLLQRGRWGLAVDLGGTLQLYRGGARAVWDGTVQEYVLRNTGPRGGPYRPVSLQLLTGLEASYRLSGRLMVTGGVNARWWAVPVGRPGTTTGGRGMAPTLQAGLSYGL